MPPMRMRNNCKLFENCLRYPREKRLRRSLVNLRSNLAECAFGYDRSGVFAFRFPAERFAREHDL